MVRRSTCMGGTIPDGTDLVLAKDEFSVSEKAVGALTVEYSGGGCRRVEERYSRVLQYRADGDETT